MKVQDTVFALETMEEITLVKESDFVPVTTAKDALDRLGNDPVAFLAIINDGLESAAKKALKNDSAIAWMQETDDGKLVPFSGTVANMKAVNGLTLTLAKSVFGYTKEASLDEKRAAKASALEMIRTTPAIVAGLQKNAAAE